MSKAIKSIGRAVKKAVKWVAKNIVPILAVAALVYTGGAAMGFFQGVAAGGTPAYGMAGIQAAWGGGAAAASTAGSASAALEGAAVTGAATGTAATGAAATGAAATGVTGSFASGGALSMAAAPTLPAGLMAPAAAAAGAGGGGIGVGTALLASTGVSAGGALLQAKATEDAAEEERARQDAEKAEYNRNMYAFGVNREGKQDANYSGGDWDSVMKAAPAGLMAPRAAAPAPQTIDDLIRARQQGAA